MKPEPRFYQMASTTIERILTQLFGQNSKKNDEKYYAVFSSKLFLK